MTDNKHIWTIIMAGGLGSRFWPLAGVDSPKQFIDVMGTGQTMLQNTFRRFAQVSPRDHIIIVTGEQYTARVREQVPGLEPWQVLGEPLRRNTAPCIAYAASIIKQMDVDATIIVTPSDHAVFHEDRFYTDLGQAIDTVAEHDWIITIGAQPTRPDTSYGYIQFREAPSLPNVANLHPVVTFTEKPPVTMARQMIASGEFFWNTGLLVWRLPVLEEAFRNHLPAIADSFSRLGLQTPATDLESIYSTCETISIDHGIMERAENVHVMAASFGWSDVETWDSLYDVSPLTPDGNAVLGNENVFTYDSHNCIVAMPDDHTKTIILEGLDGYIVAADENTLMVCRRKNEEMVFKFSSDVELKKLIDNK